MNDENKNKELQLLKENIIRAHGKGSATQLSDITPFDENKIHPSGSIALDIALGIGGYPKGRILELYGPESSGKTTLALHAIAQVQQRGGNCAFVDAEHALDVVYAKSLKVDTDAVLLSQPNYGEQALDIVEMMARSGVIDMIVVDSVAALVPKCEIEGEMGDHAVGAHARLMSKAMRKLVAITNESQCTIIFINQIRMKIGVMFGCFHYDARVLLANGTTEKIGKIVNNKIDVEILCKSKEGKLEPKKIIDWHDNGKAEKFYNLVVDYPHGKGRSYLPIGDDHNIFTPEGEKLASALKIGDEVLVKSKSYMTNEQMEIAIGTFLGDASIRTNDAGNTASLRLGHGQAQYTYLQYKTRYLGTSFMNNFYETGNNGFGCDSHPTNELIWLDKYKKNSALKFIDNELMKKITVRSIAIWYLDDGTFSGSYRRWGWGKSEICASKLDKKSKDNFVTHCLQLGLPAPTITNRGFLFSGKKNKLFHEMIAKHTPECMIYKIHPKFRYLCDQRFAHTEHSQANEIKDTLIKGKIIDIYDKPTSKKTHKFDITVEDNHNYFVDNVLVHNSPETTTGGNALKFYASQRLEIRRGAKIEEGSGTEKALVGNLTKVKIVKNKLAPPFKVAEFNIMYGMGIDLYGEILDFGVADALIIKEGSWYKLPDEGNTRIGQGKQRAIGWLRENPEESNRIHKEIMELRGLI